MGTGTTERNGIIYFDAPEEVDYSDWAFDHLDCDSIITNDDALADVITVLCYAKSKEYNAYLRAVRAEQFPDALIMMGVDSKEVNCID